MNRSMHVGISHVHHRMVANLSQDVRYKDKQVKLMKNLTVHENIKDFLFLV